jgi:hypothetical protein
MRQLRRHIFRLLALAALAIWFGPPAWNQARLVITEFVTNQRKVTGDALMSVVYPLRRRTWLEFPIPPATERLRVLSKASIPPDALDLPETEWRYVLGYEVTNSQGSILQRQNRHFRTRLTRYRDDADGLAYTGSFYLDQSILPADGRQMLVDLIGLSDAAHFRVRLENAESPVQDVAIRVYAPAKVAEHKLGTMWLRMSDEDKQSLAKGSVHPHSLLSEDEIRNLLRNQWQPLGPGGLKGRDYFSRRLYVLKDIEGEKLDEPIPTRALLLEPMRYGAIPIPERGGALRLHFPPPDVSSPDAENGPIQMLWYGRTLRERRHETIPLQSEPFDHTIPFIDGGLLELRSPVPIMVQAFLLPPSGEEEEITPEPLYVKTYALNEQKPLIFDVVHVKNRPTPLRLDVRRLLPAGSGGPSQPVAVRYELVGRRQQIIGEGQLPSPVDASSYDLITEIPPYDAVTDAASYYFLLPDNVLTMRLYGSRQSILSAYNRPFGLPKISRVPEDAYVATDKQDWRPGWFRLDPTNQRELDEQHRSVLVQMQHRPPQDDPDIVGGRYLWQDLKPQRSAIARSILTEKEPDESIRSESLVSRYCQRSFERDVTVQFEAHGRLRQIQPQLIFLREGTAPFQLTVMLDGRLLDRSALMGRRGVVRLPPVAAGRHRVRIHSSSRAELLLNQIAGCSGRTFLKRRVYRLDRNGLSFFYDRQQRREQILSARFYAPLGTTEQSTIAVEIVGPSQRPSVYPVRGWTFDRRIFDLRPVQGAPAPVLNTPDQSVNQGQPFFIPLMQDLPPGRFRIEFRLRRGPSGYLSLILLEPGLHTQRWIYHEIEAHDVELDG